MEVCGKDASPAPCEEFSGGQSRLCQSVLSTAILAGMNTTFPLLIPQGAAGSDGVPEWVHLCPAGSFTGEKGTSLVLANPDAVISASLAGGKILLDENHATDLAAPNGGASPARAWVTRMESRADGIWGYVDWSAEGKALMQGKAYRWISPVLKSQGGVVTQILRAALTNTPDLPVVSLHSRKTPEKTEMDIAKLRAALGLPDTATESDVMAAIAAKGSSTVTLHSAVATALGVDKAADEKTVLAAIQAKATAGQEPGQVAKLEAQIAEMKQQASRDKAQALLDKAASEGATINEKKKADLITLHSSNAQLAEDLIANLPRTNLNGSRVTMHSAAGAGGEGRIAGASDTLVSKLAGSFGLDAAELKKEVGNA